MPHSYQAITFKPDILKMIKCLLNSKILCCKIKAFSNFEVLGVMAMHKYKIPCFAAIHLKLFTAYTDTLKTCVVFHI